MRREKALAPRLDQLGIDDAKIVVVGNISVGGTGKTPLLIALAKRFQANGQRVGILSRGHGGSYLKHSRRAQRVTPESDPRWVGDEPVMISRALAVMDSDTRDVNMSTNTSIPLIVCPNRLEGLHVLCEKQSFDVILCDDGLQHYKLPRHIELALIDGQRGFGNQRLLPAGPLREPIERLASVDAIIVNGESGESGELGELGELNDTLISEKFNELPCFTMEIKELSLRWLKKKSETNDFYGKQNLAKREINNLEQLFIHHDIVHVIAGIGHPKRFFKFVEKSISSYLTDVTMITHAFPDHHAYSLLDLQFSETEHKKAAIVMTAKDAVKCQSFANDINMPLYAVDIEANIDDNFFALLQRLLNAN